MYPGTQVRNNFFRKIHIRHYGNKTFKFIEKLLKGRSVHIYDNLDFYTLKSNEIWDILDKNTIRTYRRNLRIVTKSLFGYKLAFNSKTGAYCIVNIYVPAGSLISFYTGSVLGNTKFRTNLCITHSIWDCLEDINIEEAYSTHRSTYKYKANPLLVSTYKDLLLFTKNNKSLINLPEHSFSLEDKTCSSGIHFFLDPIAALSY